VLDKASVARYNIPKNSVAPGHRTSANLRSLLFAWQFAERNQKGQWIAIEPKDFIQLVDAVLSLYVLFYCKNTDLANSLGHNRKAFIERYYSRGRVAVNCIRVFYPVNCCLDSG